MFTKGFDMASARKYRAELRERDADVSLNQAVLRIGPRVGVNPDTLRG